MSSAAPLAENFSYHYLENSTDNQIVLRQNEALLKDDPLLSSTNILYLPNSRNTQDSEYEYDACEEVSSSTNFQCKWERCFQIYESQTNLVKHIEKIHVELKRGRYLLIISFKCISMQQ